MRYRSAACRTLSLALRFRTAEKGYLAACLLSVLLLGIQPRTGRQRDATITTELYRPPAKPCEIFTPALARGHFVNLQQQRLSFLRQAQG